jgi:hypothetical protein
MTVPISPSHLLPPVAAVHIGNHVGNKDLDDEGLVAFLQHCAALDAPVLIHPWDMANPDDRLSRYMMGCALLPTLTLTLTSTAT